MRIDAELYCSMQMRAALLYKRSMTKTVEELRYPIGRFRAVMPVTSELRSAAIDAIAGLPRPDARSGRRTSTTPSSTPSIDLTGWTIRQVVHHVADSHMNGLIRVKLALTEETPTIKPYDENAWALLADMRSASGRVAWADRRHSRPMDRRLSRHDRWRTSSDRSCTPSSARSSRSIGICRTTRGIRTIISRTSPSCGARRGGKIADRGAGQGRHRRRARHDRDARARRHD